MLNLEGLFLDICSKTQNFQFILQVEARVLDFNEWSTPVRKKEEKKVDITIGGKQRHKHV